MSNFRRNELLPVIIALAAVIVLGALAYPFLGIGTAKGWVPLPTPAAESGEGTAEPGETEDTGRETETGTQEETEPASAETEPTAPTESREPSIAQIPDSRVNAITSAYSTEVKRLVTGLDFEKDPAGRPVAVNRLLESFQGKDVRVAAYAGGANEKVVSFTFLCDEEYGDTDNVMDILERYGIRASFYVTHYFAAHSPECLRRMISDGHIVGNQSYQAPEGGIAKQSMFSQMSDALNMQTYVRTVFGYNMGRYYFPDGYYSDASVALMSELGYDVRFGSVSYDDKDPEKAFNRDEVLSKLESDLHPGANYCFHTVNEVTVKILEELILYIQAQGYTFAVG